MRPDGDSEPDDYGLPPVDVVVPDDARELAGEIDAYQRERRLLRRRERVRRLLSPVTRFGVAIPIIAGALLVALVSGALLTTFGPRPMPRPTTALLNPHPTASPGRIGGQLPPGEVQIGDGQPETVVLHKHLRPAVIVIAAPGCGCGKQVAELAGRAQESELGFWLAGDPRGGAKPDQILKELRALKSGSHSGSPQLVRDGAGLLARAYGPPGKPAGLTAVLVESDGVVRHVLRDVRPGTELTDKIKALR